MNKKQLMYALPLSAVLLLGACGDKDKDKEETTTTTETTTDETTGTTETTQDTEAKETNSIDTNILFKEFKVEIEYPKGEYKLKYEKEDEKEKAKLEDEREGKKLEGEEALASYQSTLEQFTFDSATTDDEVKEQLLEYMDIDDDYEKIKLKVKFEDDTHKEYKFTK